MYCTEKDDLIAWRGVLKQARCARFLVGDVQLHGTRVYGRRASNPERQLGETGPSAARPCFVRSLGCDGWRASESAEDLPDECSHFALW